MIQVWDRRSRGIPPIKHRGGRARHGRSTGVVSPRPRVGLDGRGVMFASVESVIMNANTSMDRRYVVVHAREGGFVLESRMPAHRCLVKGGASTGGGVLGAGWSSQRPARKGRAGTLRHDSLSSRTVASPGRSGGLAYRLEASQFVATLGGLTAGFAIPVVPFADLYHTTPGLLQGTLVFFPRPPERRPAGGGFGLGGGALAAIMTERNRPRIGALRLRSSGPEPGV
jgi:hypothetical protein